MPRKYGARSESFLVERDKLGSRAVLGRSKCLVRWADSFVAEVDAIVGDFSTRRIEIPTSARCNRIFAETSSPSGVDFPIINLTAENCFATLRCRERERFVLFRDPPTNNPGINSHPIVSLPSFRLDIFSLFRVTQPSKEKSQLTPETHGNAA